MLTVEIINTGSELLLGSTQNTHAAWLSQKLSLLGYKVTRHVTVSDNGIAIERALSEALKRADLVLTTGGLGPTSDDITRERVARLLGLRLEENPIVLAGIEAFFAARQRAMPESTKVQSMVPEGATVFLNSNGTAPGLAVLIRDKEILQSRESAVLVMLPGPPRELRPMFENQVTPWLNVNCAVAQKPSCVVLRTIGLGESVVEEMIDQPLSGLIQDGLELGYCARLGQVDVRLLARGGDAEETVSQAEIVVRKILGHAIFGQGQESLESVVLKTLHQKALWIATAESCTGGHLSDRLTSIPGASEVCCGGVVAYSNKIKSSMLGVPDDLIIRNGAVSSEVAQAMAEGGRVRLGADIGVALTGIAGPGGGTKDKPVGTVFIAVASASRTTVWHRVFPTDRISFKEAASNTALDLVYRELREL